MGRMDKSKLINSSVIWNSDDQLKIECNDTDYGIFDQETWFELKRV